MEPKKVHFVGIGGAGVSAVAAFAKAEGFEITGCDLDQTSQFLDSLKNAGVTIFPEHDPEHLDKIDTLVVSPAIESLDPNNPELTAAKQKNIPVLIGEKFLSNNLLKSKKVIAISGVHGKSTTTAMIGKILEDAGLHPSVMVGAVVSDWGKNYRIGSGEYFVLEADEYQEKFLLYSPYISVVTAIEMDHPEYFKNLDQIKQSFQKFVDKTAADGRVVLGKNVALDPQGKQKFILGKDFQVENLNLKLIGDFNQSNAAIAFQVAKLIGVSEQQARTSLERFSGVGRRFEFRGEERGIKIFDDYAHHPTAIAATAGAAREKFPNQKIWLVYQPHMFSRTKYLETEFIETFKTVPADQVILVDIFAARQDNRENISSKQIVDQVNRSNVRYIGDFENTAYFLAKNLNVGDVVIVMGAGDIYKLSGLLLNKLRNQK